MMSEDWMKKAIELSKSVSPAEVPIAALVVKDGQLIAEGINSKESKNDPCGHAEINALRTAAKKLGSWRLEGCDLYVTLEPCLMCSGAIIQSRINKLYFAAYDPKGGAVTSCLQAFESKNINHKPKWQGGLLETEASSHLSAFFKKLRDK